jgi:hypothetical protein
VPRHCWEQALCETGRDHFGIAWEPWQPEAQLTALATELANHKFSQPVFNQRR